VRSCEDRRDFWIMLRSLCRLAEPSRTDIENAVRNDMAGKLAMGLMQLATGGSGAPVSLQAMVGAAPAAGTAPATGGDYMAPWIDSEQCTACDECTKLNGKIFAYNAQKKAVIKDPLGGPYKDLVKAAERCTARVIHPGLPKDRSEKDVDKLIARAAKFN